MIKIKEIIDNYGSCVSAKDEEWQRDGERIGFDNKKLIEKQRIVEKIHSLTNNLTDTNRVDLHYIHFDGSTHITVPDHLQEDYRQLIVKLRKHMKSEVDKLIEEL